MKHLDDLDLIEEENARRMKPVRRINPDPFYPQSYFEDDLAWNQLELNDELRRAIERKELI